MRRIDSLASEQYLIPSLLLMENAGRAVADFICQNFPQGSVTIFIGTGNNGGDGLVAARYLHNRGFDIRVILLDHPARLKGDPRLNHQILHQMNVSILIADQETVLEALHQYCRESIVLVDAIFGIGLQRPVQGHYEKVIQIMNQSQRPVISVDIPSGLDADTGKVLGIAVQATTTITFALPKKGLEISSGPAHAGQVKIADIGIPRELLVPFFA